MRKNNIELEKYLEKKENAHLYDFTDIKAESEYSLKKGVEKYLIYKLSDSEYNEEWHKALRDGENMRKQLLDSGVFNDVGDDPDNNSPILRKIYKELWDDKNLAVCSDTMNSVQTIWNEYIKYEKKDQIKKKTGLNTVSLRIITNQFTVKNEDGKYSFKINDGYVGKAEELMNVYHTIGNYIPVPKKINVWKNRTFCDCFDLFLAYIYNCYNSKKVSNSNDYKYIHLDIHLEGTVFEELDKWLESFGDWDTFIEKNYLRNYVSKSEYKGEKYGEPIELWEGHFEGKVLPTTAEQCNEYFEKASELIKKRGEEMIKKLLEKCRFPETV